MTDAREAKLPVWARNELARLRTQVDHWQREATIGPEDSNTEVYRPEGGNTPLGESPTIRFEIDPWAVSGCGFLDCTVQETPRGRYLEVRSPGGDYVEINPDVTNTIRVRPVHWEQASLMAKTYELTPAETYKLMIAALDVIGSPSKATSQRVRKGVAKGNLLSDPTIRGTAYAKLADVLDEISPGIVDRVFKISEERV